MPRIEELKPRVKEAYIHTFFFKYISVCVSIMGLDNPTCEVQLKNVKEVDQRGNAKGASKGLRQIERSRNEMTVK